MNQLFANLFQLSFDHWTDFLFLSLGGLTIIAFIIQAWFYLGYYLRIHRYKPKENTLAQDPVTVIICAKNEGENLRKFLPLVLSQEYPNYQVVVVNDGSQDETPAILAEFEQQYSHLYVTNIEHTHPYPHAKKLAQTIGIKAAKYDQLLFIDADCRPASPHWIEKMQANFRPRTEIILGYGAYEKEKGLTNKFIRTDTVWIAQQYLGFAIAGKPFMGVGRNLAYRRSLFFNNKGFANQLHLQSGDDDLFVNQTATQENTSVEFHPDSFTYSEPMHSMNEWMRQKRRHLTTGFHYHWKDRLRIGLEVISRELFFVSIIVLLAFWKLPGYLILLLLFRWILHLWIFKLTIKKLGEKGIWLFSIIYDLFMPAISGFLVLKTALKKNKKFNW